MEQLAPAVRARVHMVSLPNRRQGRERRDRQRPATPCGDRGAGGLVEGFGLTVAEALWKGRPVIASAVGGIQDQITRWHDGATSPSSR